MLNKLFKQVFRLFILALAISVVTAIPVQATAMSVTVIPAQPTSADQVTLKADGYLPTPCHTILMPLRVQRNGSDITVDIFAVSGTGVCIQVIASFSVSANLGALPIGGYRYTTRLFINSSVVDTASGNFLVASPPATGPLPHRTLLTIDPGVVDTSACRQGSCFGWESAPGFFVWTAIGPGTDRGIVIGKNQLPGEQHLGIGEGPGSSSSGELTSAWLFMQAYGTFATAPFSATRNFPQAVTDASANLFDSVSCSGAGCDGKTVLGTWHAAYNGSALPLGGATSCSSNPTYCVSNPVIAWTLQPAGVAGVDDDRYILDYSALVDQGFMASTFKLHLEGTVNLPGNPPTTSDLMATAVSGGVIGWRPIAADPDGDPITCRLGTPPLNGTATVAGDCSSGTYQSNPGFVGADSFTYLANDGQADSNPATVTVAVVESPDTAACKNQYPVSQFSQTGKEGTITISFTGNITSHTNKEVKVCPGTTLNYQVSSTQGPVVCKVKNNTTRGSGSLKINDHIKCTDKPAGKDKIQFKAKSGVK